MTQLHGVSYSAALGMAMAKAVKASLQVESMSLMRLIKQLCTIVSVCKIRISVILYMHDEYCGMYAREVDVTRLRKRALLGNG
jgi:hypothetical protein